MSADNDVPRFLADRFACGKSSLLTLIGRAASIADASLAEAVRKGWITPPLMRQPIMPRRPGAPLSEILADLAEDRGDR